MLDFLRNLLRNDFMPHGHCYLWRPEMVWLHTVSDGLIALAYYSIPVALVYFVRKRKDIAFHWLFLMFGAFIFACGTTHAMNIWTLWIPTYRLDGLIKLITALLSIATAIALWPQIPKALALPGPADLERANAGLRTQVMERKLAEQRVRRLNEELEARVRQRTAELERSNQELRQFAHVASHDLQEPLRMVSAYSQLLSARCAGRLGSDADEIIVQVVDGAHRMHALVNGLLAYARVDNQGRGFEPTDSGQALEDALADLRMAIAESGATVTHSPMPQIAADPSQLRRVFQNLIGNAIKFRGSLPPRIHVEASREGGEWTFSVRDNGIGIQPEHRDRIFVIFQRLHSREQYPGTGIGLSICKKIVERHDGRIWVESEPGQGSTFRFTLPARAVRAA